MQRTKRSAAASKTVTSKQTLNRGEDEIAWLGTRQNSTPYKPATVRAQLTELLKERRDDQEAEGVAAHRQGTTLMLIYARHGDRALGFKSFKRFLQQHWPDSVDDAYRRMRIARYCTRRESRLGISKCDRGIRLMALLELKKFRELLDAKKPVMLRLPGGAEVSFADASVTQLDAALGLLAAGDSAIRQGTPTLSTMLAHLRELTESRPEFRQVHPTAVVVEGEVEVRVRARGYERQLIAAKFFDALSKKKR